MIMKQSNFQVLISFLLLSILVPANSVAQVDTIYIVEEKTNYTLGLSTRYRQYSVDLLNDKSKEWDVNKNDISIGIRARYKWLNLAVIFAIHDLYDEQSFAPDLVNIDVKLYPNSYFVKANIQYTSLLQPVPNVLSNLSEFSKSSKLMSVTLWAAYLFNSDQISLSSSYSFVDRQKKTAGSWLIASFLEEHRLSIDSDEANDLDFLADFLPNSLNKTRLGIGGGYTQSIVWNDFVWNSILTGGFEIARAVSDLSPLIEPKIMYDLAPNIRFNSSLVYHRKSYYFALIGEFYPDVFSTSDSFDLEKNHWWIRLGYGYKF